MSTELDNDRNGIIDNQYLPLPLVADASGVYTNSAINIGYTPEGGVACKLTNRTGSASVKGQAINFSPTYDDSYITATDTLSVTGFVYESGKADGAETWVVRRGIVDALLQDGYGAIRNGWVRLSATTPGRVVVQAGSGYERAPTSVTYTKGSTVSGALTDLLLDNGNKLVIAEATGTPGIDATFTFLVDEPLSEIRAAGFYPNNHSSGIQFFVWNFTSSSWGTVMFTFPANGTDDVVYSQNSLTADNFSAGEMRVRVYHPDPGNTLHRVNIDKLVLASSAAGEHFRELGHTTRAAVAGTNVLTRLDIHFL